MTTSSETMDWKARAEAAEAEVEHQRRQVGYWSDYASRQAEYAAAWEAKAGQVQSALGHVKALSDQWALTEFPDERTADLMRLDLHRALLAAADADRRELAERFADQSGTTKAAEDEIVAALAAEPTPAASRLNCPVCGSGEVGDCICTEAEAIAKVERP